MAWRINRLTLAFSAVYLVIPTRWASAADDREDPPARPPAAETSPNDVVPWTPSPAFNPYALSGVDFYLEVNRPDLATEYEVRHGLRIATRVAGGLALGVGAYWWLGTVLAEGANGCADDPACAHRTYWGPDITMVAGLLLIFAPAFWSNDPVSPAEKDLLVRAEYHRRYPGVPLSLSVSAAPTANGGGNVVFSGRF